MDDCPSCGAELDIVPDVTDMGDDIEFKECPTCGWDNYDDALASQMELHLDTDQLSFDHEGDDDYEFN